MDFQKAKEIFNLLFEGVDGYKLSFESRNQLGFYDQGLTYGEIFFDTFYKMLEKTQPKEGEVFYDLGSGTGKAVFAAYFLFPFSKTVGIEILPTLYQASKTILEKYEKEVRPKILEKKNQQKIEFILGDFLKIDFSDADVVFANSTCFSQQMIDKLETSFLSLKKGARIITLTKKLTNKNFYLFDFLIYKQSWGEATVNFYLKQ
jgi:SAM-dependent methyltransferase